MIEHVHPTLLFLASLVSVQLGSAFATTLFKGLGPVGTTFSSSGFSALVFLLVIRPRFDRNLRAQAGLLSLYGATLVAMELPFFLSLQYIELGLAATITFSGPLCLATFLSRRLRQFLWIALAAAGLFLLAPGVGASLDVRGVALAGASAVGWAAFAPLSKQVGRALSDADGLVFGMIAATFFLTPLAIAEGAIFQAGVKQLSGAFSVALLTSALPMVLEFNALQRMSSRTYGVLATLEPAIATIIGFVFLAQPIGLKGALAVGCVTLASIGFALSDEERS